MTRARAALVTLLASAAAAVLLLASARAEEMAPAPDARPVVPDPAWFRDAVLPLAARHCLECHDEADPENVSQHRLATPGADGRFSEADVERNYRMWAGLLDPREPERSRLLLKLLPVEQGGVDHDGGKAGEMFPRGLVAADGPLVRWVLGGGSAAAPPVAAVAAPPRTVVVGEPVLLDATASHDPDGDLVAYRWEVVDRPQGATARVEDDRAPRTRIVPDRAGRFVVRLRTNDGKLRGWPAVVRFAATRPAEEPTAPAAPARPDAIDPATRRDVRALHLDLMGRTPTADELARWAALPHPQRVDGLLATDEAWKHWFDEEAFYFLLIDGFRPVSDRLAAVPPRMREGAVGFRDAHTEFALSAEWNARNPGNDTFVTVVLEQFLGLEVQKETRLLEAAKKAYDGKPQRVFGELAQNQSDVVRIVLRQREATDLFVRRMARRYLHGELPPAEHAATVDLLHASPAAFRSVLRQWLVAPRHTAPDRAPRAKTDSQFIGALFVDLLGRAPSYEEFRNMRNALLAVADPRPIRGVLAKVLLDSEDVLPPPLADPAADPTGNPHRATVRDLFHRLLGRDPTEDELSAFTSVLAEPGATWRTAALALLTSAQYQYY